jgi:hypothetical protein
MELKLQEHIKAAIEIDGQSISNLENSIVYANWEENEGFIQVKTSEGKEIKIRFKNIK